MGFISSALGARNEYQANPQYAAQQNINPVIQQQLATNPITAGAPAQYQPGQITSPQQQALAQQLMAQSQGAGPNPAAIALQQATNRNIAQGAGMIASEKGINAGTQNRLIAQNTAAQNQAAAGQGAQMQAQQQLAAQGQLASLTEAQQQAALAQRGQDIQNALQYGALQNQAVGLQNQQRGMQNQYLEGLMGLQNQQQGQQLQAQLQAQQIASGVAAQNVQQQNQITGQLIGAAGAAGASAAGAPKAAPAPVAAAKGGYIDGKANVDGDSEANDTVPAMLSPGEIVIPRTKVQDGDAAHEFLEQLLAKKGKGTTYSDVLKAKRKMKG